MPHHDEQGQQGQAQAEQQSPREGMSGSVPTELEGQKEQPEEGTTPEQTGAETEGIRTQAG